MILLAKEGKRYVSLVESEIPQELYSFAKEAHITGIIVGEYVAVDFSGEKKQHTERGSLQKAFSNLINKPQSTAAVVGKEKVT